MLGVAACLSWLFVNNQYTIRLRDHGQEADRILSGHLVIPQVYLCFKAFLNPDRLQGITLE